MRRCAWLAVVAIGACSGRQASPARGAPRAVTTPTSSETHGAETVDAPPSQSEPTPEPEQDDPPRSDAANDESKPNTSEPSAHVELEAPYSSLGHARLATEMLTLGRDQELVQWALGGSLNPAHPANRPGFHPATRVVLNVSLLSRAPAGTARRLLASARNKGYWPMRACFEDAEREHATGQREIRARLTLSPRGKVLAARILQSKPREPAYGRCALERLRRLDFDLELSRKLDVEIHVEEWRGDAPLPPRAPASERARDFPRDALDALAQTLPALTTCYEVALAGDSGLWGRLAFRVDLAHDGQIARAEQVETRFPNDAVVECARGALLGTRIPAMSQSSFTLAARFGQPPAPPPPLPAPASEAGAPAPPAAPPAPLPPVSH